MRSLRSVLVVAIVTSGTAWAQVRATGPDAPPATTGPDAVPPTATADGPPVPGAGDGASDLGQAPRAARPMGAAQPDVRRDDRAPHPPAGLGVTFGAGLARQAERDGWMLRLEYDVFPVMAPHDEVGGVFGFQPGVEYWRHDRDEDSADQGFAMPWLISAGVRRPALRAMVGVGFDILAIDSIDGDVGFGMFEPIAMASAYIDIIGFRLGADARAVRRWQIGADDFTQYQLVFGLGYTGSSVNPRRSARPYL